MDTANHIRTESRLLTIPDTARYLGCTVWAVRQMQWAKTVPHLRIGKRIVFDIQDLNKYIESAKIGRVN
jgi:excisionase family DNA binding protein